MIREVKESELKGENPTNHGTAYVSGVGLSGGTEDKEFAFLCSPDDKLSPAIFYGTINCQCPSDTECHECPYQGKTFVVEY
jgi:hypothetical protein